MSRASVENAMNVNPQNEKIGLALGGGAVLGAAHIGVLKAIEAYDIRLHCISGTSIGAFIAGLYAFGITADEIEAMVGDLKWLDITGFVFSKHGFLSNEKLGDIIKDRVGDVPIESAKIPLALVTTAIGSGEKVILRKGDLTLGVMASACLPGVFSPVKIKDRFLVDGGLVENVPLSALKPLGATLRIGVDLNANRCYQEPEDIIDVLCNAIDIAIDNATRIQTDAADILIAPDVNAFSRTDPDAAKNLIAVGYEASAAELGKYFESAR